MPAHTAQVPALLPPAQADVHPFGAQTRREGLLRAAAGGVLSTAGVVGGFCLAGFDGQFLLLLVGAGAAGSTVAWSVEQWRPSTWPVARYAAVGVVLAGLALLVLGWPDYGPLILLVLVALPVGAAGGAVAGAVAARLAARHLTAAVCVGVAALTCAGVVAVERTLPWLSGSYIAVEGPSSIGSAPALAERVADALRAAPDPLSDAALGKVVSGSAIDSGARVRSGYDRTADRRLVTVLVDDDRACVDVQRSVVTAYPGDCRQP